MANKQVFTAFDVYGFKKALALHAAKNNALIEKYRKLFEGNKKTLDAVSALGFCGDFDKITAVQNLLTEFLKDLNTPCDLFISKFEESEVLNG